MSIILKQNNMIELSDTKSPNDSTYKCKYKGKTFYFQISDIANNHGLDNAKIESGPPIFKYHYSRDEDYCRKEVLPFTSISFYDWKRFFKLREEIRYSAVGDIIINRQKPYTPKTQGKVYNRRIGVRELLKKQYGDSVKIKPSLSQVDFWKEISSMLVNVCVPGHHNNMIDRGQMQYMSFGACTISPYIPEIMPFRKEITSGEHYVKCKDDYSDLVDKVEWCKENRKQCIKIGNNAKRLFDETSVPDKLWKWILINL